MCVYIYRERERMGYYWRLLALINLADVMLCNIHLDITVCYTYRQKAKN